MKFPLRFLLALFAVAMASVLSGLDQTVVSTALPHIISSLQGTHLLGWVFSAYFLGATATVAVTGKLADLLGRRLVFISSIAVFGIGSLLCGLANSMLLLVAFRGLQGIGAGSIQTCSLIVMGDMFSPRERGKWQVINSVGFVVASAIGPSVGGIISDAFSWRWIFLLNVPICAATIGALWYGITDVSRAGARLHIDWLGGMLSTVSVIALLLALTWGGSEYAWLSPEIVGLIGLTLFAGALLVRVERRAPEPIIPGELLRGAVLPFACLAGLANSLVWFGLILLAPLQLQLVLRSSATAAGAALTPGIIFSPICAFVAGQILSRSGRYRVVSVAAGFFQLAGVIMMLLSPARFGPPWVALSFGIAGIGTGFGAVTFMIAFQNAIPFRLMGAGMGLFSLFRQFGASVGTALIGAIAGAGAASGANLRADSIRQAWLVPAAAALLLILVSRLMADLPLRSYVVEEEGVEAAGPALAVGGEL